MAGCLAAVLLAAGTWFEYRVRTRVRRGSHSRRMDYASPRLAPAAATRARRAKVVCHCSQRLDVMPCQVTRAPPIAAMARRVCQSLFDIVSTFVGLLRR